MSFFKKVAVSVAATSLAFLPVAASAQTALDSASMSTTDGQSELEGGSWVAILLGIAIIGGGIWLAIDGNDDTPTSP